jgi:hypothetical protein
LSLNSWAMIAVVDVKEARCRLLVGLNWSLSEVRRGRKIRNDCIKECAAGYGKLYVRWKRCYCCSVAVH